MLEPGVSGTARSVIAWQVSRVSHDELREVRHGIVRQVWPVVTRRYVAGPSKAGAARAASRGAELFHLVCPERVTGGHRPVRMLRYVGLW